MTPPGDTRSIALLEEPALPPPMKSGRGRRGPAVGLGRRIIDLGAAAARQDHGPEAKKCRANPHGHGIVASPSEGRLNARVRNPFIPSTPPLTLECPPSEGHVGYGTA